MSKEWVTGKELLGSPWDLRLFKIIKLIRKGVEPVDPVSGKALKSPPCNAFDEKKAEILWVDENYCGRVYVGGGRVSAFEDMSADQKSEEVKRMIHKEASGVADFSRCSDSKLLYDAKILKRECSRYPTWAKYLSENDPGPRDIERLKDAIFPLSKVGPLLGSSFSGNEEKTDSPKAELLKYARERLNSGKPLKSADFQGDSLDDGIKKIHDRHNMISLDSLRRYCSDAGLLARSKPGPKKKSRI